MDPKKIAPHSIKVEEKVLMYKEDGFYLIRLYDMQTGECLHTDSYFVPSDTMSEIKAEAEDFQFRVNQYPSAFHVTGEIQYIQRQ